MGDTISRDTGSHRGPWQWNFPEIPSAT